jgi:hypothetical protein
MEIRIQAIKEELERSATRTNPLERQPLAIQ